MYRGRVPIPHTQALDSDTAEAITLTDLIVSAALQNDPDSADSIWVGDADNQYLELEPGKSLVLTMEDLTRVYVKTAAQGSATLNVLAIA